MQPFLQVNLLGEFSVRWGDTVLVDPTMRMNKNLELFAMLLLYADQPLSNEQLMDFLWEDKASNPAGALKNAVYSLRRMLHESAPNVPFILTNGQQYQLNPDIPVQSDFVRFRQLCRQMRQSGVLAHSQLELGREALHIYKAELLPYFSNRPWLNSRKQSVFDQYIQVSVHTAQLLLSQHNCACAHEALSICSRAAMLAPQQENIYPHLFNALQQLEMKTAVLNYYPIAIELCYQQMNKPVPRSLRQIYLWASENNACVQEDLMRIRMDLNETIRSELPLQGAYFCNYDAFRHMYHMLARNASRSGNALAILLFSLHPDKRLLPSRQQTASAMAVLRRTIRSTLRKGDVFCQFSRFQYVTLLSMTKYEDCHAVEKRLDEAFKKQPELKNFVIQMDFTAPDPIV